MRPPKHGPAKPHCFLTHCSLNPEASSTNVSEETHYNWRPQESLEGDGTRTSWLAKLYPNPDDAGPIVHRLIGLSGIEPRLCALFTTLIEPRGAVVPKSRIPITPEAL